MGGIDLSALLGVLTKSGAATIVLALLVGASYLVREWRGGSASVAKEGDLTKRLEDVEKRLSAAETRISRLNQQLHGMRYMRDQARVRVEFLELTYRVDPRTTWPPDEEGGAEV